MTTPIPLPPRRPFDLGKTPQGQKRIYSPPQTAIPAGTGGELRNLLAFGTPDIVLTGKLYGDGPLPFDVSASRVWAPAGTTIGHEPVIAIPIELGNQKGTIAPELHGLRILAPPGKFGAQVSIYGGGGVGAAIRDCSLDGAFGSRAGIYAAWPDAIKITRCRVKDQLGVGVFLDANSPSYYPAHALPLIEDLYVENCHRTDGGNDNGTSEACLWVGVPMAHVARCHLSNPKGWMSLWIGDAATGSHFVDITAVDCSNVQVYFEHLTTGVIFERFWVSGGIVKGAYGFNFEWDDDIPGYGSTHHATIRNGTVAHCTVGFGCAGNGLNDSTVEEVKLSDVDTQIVGDNGTNFFSFV